MFRAVSVAVVSVAVSSFFFAGKASAQCVESLPDVTCAGADADGYDAGANEDLDVDVQVGATVDGGANTEAIRLNDGSSVANAGDVTLSTNDGVALQMGDDATITNDGNITASGNDGRAIAVGDGADITNAGVITGGADGASDTAVAIDFTGTDAGATNVVRSTGTITGGADGAVDGSAGRDEILLQSSSVTTGDINTNGGDDLVRLIGGGAVLTGDVNLGDGNDRMDINGMVTAYGGDVDGGDGNNMFIVTGSGAEFTGNYTGGADADRVFFFQNTTVASDNLFDLGGGDDEFNIEGGGTTGTYDFNMLGGDGNDTITFETDVVVSNADVDLGADDDTLVVQDGADVGGSFVLGAGSDSVDIQGDPDVLDMSGPIVTGNIDLGVADDVADDVNTFTLGINATLDGDLLGGAGEDSVTLDQAAEITGQVNLGAGDDTLTFGEGASIGGSIDLGAGNDRVTVLDDANLDLGGGTLVAGDGNDTIVLSAPEDSMVNAGAIITGNIDLGDAEVDTAGNRLVLRDMTMVDGNVTGGAQSDQLEMRSDTTITGTVSLGGGDDQIVVRIDSLNVVVGGLVDLGSGDDFLAIAQGAVVEADITMGDDADEVWMSNLATLDGTLDLGAGDDVVVVRPSFMVPENLTLGAGSDTLQIVTEDDSDLGANPVFERDIFAIQDAQGLDRFERLVVGYDDDDFDSGDQNLPWQLSTSGRAQFVDGVVFQNVAVVFDGPFQVEGDVTQENNTQLVFDLGDDVDNGQLNVIGGMTINASGPDEHGDGLDEIAGVVVQLNGELASGDYDLIVTTTGIDREYEEEEVTLPDLVVYSFDLGRSDDDLRLVLEVVRNDYSTFGRNASEMNVGTYMEVARALAGNTGPFIDFTSQFDGLSRSQINTALSQLNAEAYDAHTSSILSWGRTQQRVLHNRPLHCERFTYAPRPEVVSANPCGKRGVMPWARAVGDLGSHDGDHDRGYDTFGGGGIVGIDHRINDRYWWSGSVGFGQIEIENDNDADGEFQTIDLGAAAGATFGAIQTRASLTYSHGFHEIDRKVDFLGETLNAKFDSDRVGLLAEASYRARVGPVVLAPGVRAGYTHVNEESADESGHEVVALEVEARKTDVYSLAGGVALSSPILKYAYVGDWLEWADGVWTPMVSLYWRQDFGDVDRDLTAAFDGADSDAGDFDSEARDSNGGFEVRGGVSFQPLESGVAVGVYYDGYFGDDVMNHSANASVRVAF